ncbi:ADP-ribose pyrophosphatase [Frondihabitans sp. PAMC 28766]|uniref:NUDIX hydrolase n=1 Tax=Frondihabitans sp. PAMC 28766 TaxID=1795630 RepID=UPI00078DA669|nr:NUDIX domain-containing protein [Frondihabitans sp. PAMC 28766]AMM22077.1 ADP-ribose pyrophosphatase [Frondihabitans sp. PAMC 28766]
MPTPDFVLDLREKIGHDPLWLSGVTAVVIRGDEVLLVKRSDTGAWTPVTGVIDPGEQPAVAGAREVLEEADIVAVPSRLAAIGVTAPVTYGNGDVSQYLDLTFRFDYVSGEPFPADGENTEAAWFALDALPEMSAEMTTRLANALAEGPAARFEF